MNITIKQLEYFVAAGEAGSIKQASERIAISQPSISSAISHLEQELNAKLFVRHHARGLALTAAGRRLLREAKLLLRQGQNLYDVAHEMQNELSGSLAVGCMVTLAPVMAAALCKSFMDHNPAVTVHLHEGSHQELLQKLHNVEIDIALCYELARPADVSFEGLADLVPQVLVSATSPLAKHAELSLEQLENEPMVLLDLPYSSQYFLSLFEDKGLKPNVVARSGSQDMIRSMVANNYGYSILNVRPKNPAAMDGRKLKLIRLVGDQVPTRIGFMTLTQTGKTRLLSVFEDHCRAMISSDGIPGMAAPA